MFFRQKSPTSYTPSTFHTFPLLSTIFHSIFRYHFGNVTPVALYPIYVWFFYLKHLRKEVLNNHLFKIDKLCNYGIFLPRGEGIVLLTLSRLEIANTSTFHLSDWVYCKGTRKEDTNPTRLQHKCYIFM